MKKKRSKIKHFGATAEQVTAAVKARDYANSGTPKIVLNAFMPDQLTAANLPLQPVTMSVLVALEKVNSPLIKSDALPSIATVAEALYILVSPIDAVRNAIQTGALQKNVDALADTIPALYIPRLGKILNEYIADAFSTAIPHGDPGSPLAAARPQTPGSAGS